MIGYDNLRIAALAVGIIAGVVKSVSTEPRGLTVVEEPTRVVFRWNGPVETPMLEKFEQAFAKRTDDPRRIVITLQSPGGYLEHGAKVIKFIKQMQKTHEVDTAVEAGRTCASMCVPIFLAGADRKAVPSAKFMFHEVSFDKSAAIEQKLREIKRQSPWVDVDALRKEIVVRATNDFFEEFLEPKGVNARWISEMRQNIRGRDVWRTAEELVRQGSGVVDVLH